MNNLSGEFSLSTNHAISRYGSQEFGSFFLPETHMSRAGLLSMRYLNTVSAPHVTGGADQSACKGH